VVVNNGIVRVILSRPDGHVLGIQYNGIDNLLDRENEEYDRGYVQLSLAFNFGSAASVNPNLLILL